MSNEDAVELRSHALAPTWSIQIRFSYRAIVGYWSVRKRLDISML